MHQPPSPILIPVAHQDIAYPVGRIFCVGRNYLDHVREMGHDPDRKPPIFFTKWPQNYVPSGGEVPYPPCTVDFQFEVELVVAIGIAGKDISPAMANRHVFGYAVGLDMTRRDLQIAARDAGHPWDVGKNFEHSAPIGTISPATDTGHLTRGAIELYVNGHRRQHSNLAEMIWPTTEIISHLSALYTLLPGDLIMTGTPAGVGPVMPGDKVLGVIEGLAKLEIKIA